MGRLRIGRNLGGGNPGDTVSVRLPNGEVVQAKAATAINKAKVLVATDEAGKHYAYAEGEGTASVITRQITRQRPRRKPVDPDNDYFFKVLQTDGLIEGFDDDVDLDLTGYTPVGITNTGNDYVIVLTNDSDNYKILSLNNVCNLSVGENLTYKGLTYLYIKNNNGQYLTSNNNTFITFPINTRFLTYNDYESVRTPQLRAIGETYNIGENYKDYDDGTIGSYSSTTSLNASSLSTPNLPNVEYQEGDYTLTYNYDNPKAISYKHNDNCSIDELFYNRGSNHTETGGRFVTPGSFTVVNGITYYDSLTVEENITLDHYSNVTTYVDDYAHSNHINKDYIQRNADNGYTLTTQYSYTFGQTDNYELVVSYTALGWNPRLDPGTGILLGYDLNGENTVITTKWADLRYIHELNEWRGARVSDIQTTYGCEPGFFSGYRFCGTYYYLFGSYGLGFVNAFTEGRVFTNDLNRVARGFTIVNAEPPYIANASGFSASEVFVNSNRYLLDSAQTSAIQEWYYNETNVEERLETTPYLIGVNCCIYGYHKYILDFVDNRRRATQFVGFTTSGSGSKSTTYYNFENLVVKTNTNVYEKNDVTGNNISSADNGFYICGLEELSEGVNTLNITGCVKGSSPNNQSSINYKTKILKKEIVSHDNVTTKEYYNVVEFDSGDVLIIVKNEFTTNTYNGILTSVNKTVNNENITYETLTVNIADITPINTDYFLALNTGIYIIPKNNFTSFVVNRIRSNITNCNLYTILDENGNETVELAISQIPTETAEQDEWYADIYRFNTTSLKWERRPNGVSALSELTSPSDFISYREV